MKLRRSVVFHLSLVAGACALFACETRPPAIPPQAVLPVAPIAPEPTTIASAAPAPDPFEGLPPAWVEASRKIAAATKDREAAHAWLTALVDRFGHRISGSPQLERAIDFAVDAMKRGGLTNPRREKVKVPRWIRGKESAKLVTPVERELVLLGLGGTVGTGGRPLRKEVLVVPSLAELKNAGEKAKNKIVLVNEAMPPFNAETNETHYGTTAKVRWSAANEAGKLGASAVLIRSVTAFSFRTAHTGAMAPYEDKTPKIPAAALAPEDADAIARLAKDGPVTVEISLGAKTLPDGESANAVAELVGREKPDEVVVIGGHIDSWDVGEGAQDDGAGCAMALDAALVLKEISLIPRRTVRVVLFTNEENGLRGGKGYFEAHGKERHHAAMEADFGSGAPRAFHVKGTADQITDAKRWLPLFSTFGISEIKEGSTGADISPLAKAGVLTFEIVPDGAHYFDIHHTIADTLDKIDPKNLRQNAAAFALMTYLIAEMP